jgi:hypothetical protein
MHCCALYDILIQNVLLHFQVAWIHYDKSAILTVQVKLQRVPFPVSAGMVLLLINFLKIIYNNITN